MEDALVPPKGHTKVVITVLILVLMEDALVHSSLRNTETTYKS